MNNEASTSTPAPLYPHMYPISLKDYGFIGDAFCCGELKMTHYDDYMGGECGETCIFCEGECSECEKAI